MDASSALLQVRVKMVLLTTPSRFSILNKATLNQDAQAGP
jgi:hypothetical protein